MRAPRLAVSVILAGLLATIVGAPTGAMRDQLRNQLLPWCSALSVHWGPLVSPQTGEDPLAVAFVNGSSGTCVTKGYAQLQLVEAKGPALPFRVGHTSQYFVTLHPRLIVLKSGQVTHEMIAKYRCDTGEAVAVAGLRLVVPVSHQVLRLAMTKWHRAAYCKGRRGDPGNYVGISPIANRLPL